MSWIYKFVSYWHNDGHMGARRQSMKPEEEVVEISLGISKCKGGLVNRGNKEGKGKTLRVELWKTGIGQRSTLLNAGEKIRKLSNDTCLFIE